MEENCDESLRICEDSRSVEDVSNARDLHSEDGEDLRLMRLDEIGEKSRCRRYRTGPTRQSTLRHQWMSTTRSEKDDEDWEDVDEIQRNVRCWKRVHQR